MTYDPYNPYNPYSYNAPKQPQQSTYAFVSGLDGAKQYPIPVNQSMLLMDNSQPVCYLKQANAMGQTTLKCFKLVEVKEESIVTNVQQNNDINFSLDKNEEFVHLKEQVKALNSRLDELIAKEK